MSAASLGAVVLSARSLALRRLPFYHNPPYCPPLLHGRTPSRPHSTLTTAMLGQANKKFEAKRNDLAKQLFPSSSPGSSQNANIADLMKRPSHPPAPAPPMPPAAPTTRSFTNLHNAPRPPSMASLYSQANSFQDEPQTMSAVGGAQSRPVVFFNEDDFSDDDTLDFQLPTALPSLPKPPPPPPPPAAPRERHPPTSTQAEKAIPWSSSPASHLVHPLSRATSAVSRTLSHTSSLKREPQGQPETSEQCPAKKRSLPKAWKDDQESDAREQANARKLSRQDSLPWNATASDVKAQKKQLKSQGKKAGEDDTRMTTAEMAAAVTAYQSSAPKAKSLSPEQRRILDMVVDKGESVFFTGPAGTGKSFLMGSIITALKKKFVRDPERLAVTASTGLAACNIGGITLHSFSGIGLGKEDVSQLVKKIRRNPKAKNRWLKTKVLIIDEISMVDGDLFDKLSHIGRTMRNNGRPWGGIQLVITGDFFQLPPVPDTGPDSKKKEAKFAFDAATWNTSIDHTIGLTQVFRQKDPVFANMLNEMRIGRISDETVAAFKAMSRPLPTHDPVGTTELFSTRYEVENANNSRLRGLPGKSVRFEAMDTGDPAIRDRLLQNMMAPKSLELKVGAQVMLVKNMDDTLVNGSVGKVKGFSTEEIFEIKGNMKYDDELGSKTAKIKSRIQAFTKEYEQAKTGAREYPVVEFSATDDTFRTILCVPEEWKVELPTGEVQASRTQVPLILAWALSIHKAQGQTLERVKVDLGKAFEKGQAYVALSRATTQQGLQVLRFEKSRVMAHPRVVQFYDQLSTIEQAVSKRPMSVASYAAKPRFQQEVRGMAAFIQKKPAQVVEIDEDEELAMMDAYG